MLSKSLDSNPRTLGSMTTDLSESGRLNEQRTNSFGMDQNFQMPLQETILALQGLQSQAQNAVP